MIPDFHCIEKITSKVIPLFSLNYCCAFNYFRSKWYEIKEHDIEQIHVPLVRFNNIKDLRRIPNWGPKDSNYFWFRLPHNIQYFEAIQIKLFCSFTFTSYPFDSHYCDMTFGSSSNIDISVFYPQPNIFVDSGSMIQSKLPFHIHLETIAPFTQIILGSRYPNTGIRIHLARDDLGLLYGGFFGPTGLFSIMSLTSFTINPDAVPGRLGVLVTLSLIVSNVYNSIKAPPSRGFSYIEVWMIGIQIPILTAIIEYGIILCMKKYQQKQKDKIKRFDQVLDVDKLAIEMDKWTFLASLTFMLIFGPVYFFLAIRELERGLK